MTEEQVWNNLMHKVYPLEQLTPLIEWYTETETLTASAAKIS